jgi:hypothetical protein
MKKISETTNLIETTLCIYMESHGMVDYTDLIFLDRVLCLDFKSR